MKKNTTCQAPRSLCPQCPDGIKKNCLEVMTIDLTTTPDGMAKIMFTLVRDGDEAGKKLALAEIAKAFTIAYAYWYPDKPEYRIAGITGKAVKS